MKDLKIQDLKPVTKADQMLKELLDEKIYTDSVEERLLEVIPDLYQEQRD